jgi:hypothetical protein
VRSRPAQHSAGFWRFGIDVATGRSMPVAIKTPEEMARLVGGPRAAGP